MQSISSGSAWTREEIADFLSRYRAPLRISVPTESGYPLLCSIWFEFRAGRLWGATQEAARLARALSREPRCAFELAPNEPPYFGVRGRARAEIDRTGATEQLDRLIDRFLGPADEPLADRLRGRSATEVRIELDIEWITAWDYRDRMASQEGSPTGKGRR